MAIAIPAVIDAEWVKMNCRCKLQTDKRLLCQESCPIHNTFDPALELYRDVIKEKTAQLGWKQFWVAENKKD